jgi:hypothetical protein
MSLVADIGKAVRLMIESKKGLVRIIDTETNIKARNADPKGSMALGTDTDKLYIHKGSGYWLVIDTNPA